MNILSKLALAALFLTTTVAARADWVSGHFRSGGTYVAPYYRTPANNAPYDNLSYRGYPSQQPGYRSPRVPSFDSDSYRPRVMPYYGSSSTSRDFVYRNPYAAYPSVHVQGYYRSSGTYVEPHVRTAPNGILEDNLSYRGFGTIRVPRFTSGW